MVCGWMALSGLLVLVVQYMGEFLHAPTRGTDQGGFKISRVGSGRVITFYNLTGRVGSRGFKISQVGSCRISRLQNLGSGRVGSGRVKRIKNLAGRVGSGQEVFKISWVGPSHDLRYTGHSRVKAP